MSNPYQLQQQQAAASGSNSPLATPVPIKRGRGRPPKNRDPNAPTPVKAAPPPPKPTPQPRTSHITSPRLRAAQPTAYSTGSPFQPPPPTGYPSHSLGPGILEQQNVFYQPVTGGPHSSPHSVPSFPSIPTFQRQQELQQQQSQQIVREAQQARASSVRRESAEAVSSAITSSPASSSAAPQIPMSGGATSTPAEGTIMTAAGGSIGAGLGQAVGNAGASSASRTRRKADANEPELKLPEAHDDGWMNEPADAAEAQRAYSAVVACIRNHVDATGRRLAEQLEECPDPEVDPDFYEQVEKPTSLSAISQRISEGEYPKASDFEMDMLQLFENARRLHPVGSQSYGDAVVLHRLYHEITKAKPSRKEPITAEAVMTAAAQADASRHFSSIPHGPLYASAGFSGDLTTRISSKSKTYYEHLNLKGKAFRVGDWIHLINPSEPTKPIVAQIFKVLRREDDDPDQGWVTVCWYYRPEQTFHPASKKFFQDEVVKTGYFADHHIEDILEKIMVMFYTKYIRGRPKPEYWDPRSPLYVTESRYNEQQRVFHKIKSWASCVPEEIRKVETPMNFFEKAIAPPPKEESPFLRGVAGPGALRDEDAANGEGVDFPDLFKDAPDDFRPKKKGRGSDAANGEAANEVFTRLASLVAARVTPDQYLRLQQLLSTPQAATLDISQLSNELGGVDVNMLNELRNAALAAGVTSAGFDKVASESNPPQSQQPTVGVVDLVRSQRGEGFYAALPQETRDLFADQPGGQINWYAAAPLDLPLQHDLHKNGFYAPQQAHLRNHTLDYLYHQASMRNESDASTEPHMRNGGRAAPSQPLQPSASANGNSTPRAMLTGSSPYVPHASGMYDFLAPSARNSPLMRAGYGAYAGAGATGLVGSGMPAASSNGSTDEALTPVMNQNQGWYGGNEWGEDPQKTAEALAEFSNHYSDGGQLNLSHYLS
ncbi:Bromo adjacent homology (BAH) domain protein [Kalmanozyma brasiliensis GHG001]|uniref:Bromo adjacent homology (BAH) domain protein n=1 Tax=Kalmanozyma brasiliensis (strain GHG001) TaxID=1365824 RepID=UPI001CEBAE3E|nr:Bromo adjacent homology (BAH) domain protein [Kalmanozyma brasiliensis GHG001]EST08359.2 Bromo adjacent homology (BAH) domain protein [Kalmanozyma brasiliensis GHG001]